MQIGQVMKKILFIILLGILMSAKAQNSQNTLKTVDFNELQKILQTNDDILYVVNFWATWCKPCIEEIPGFMEVNSMYKDNPNFKMILVSMDHPKSINSRVKKFIQKNNMDVDVYVLDEKSPFTEWMLKIDEAWMGAIPATVLYKNGKKLFFKQFQITQYELDDLIIDNLDVD